MGGGHRKQGQKERGEGLKAELLLSICSGNSFCLPVGVCQLPVVSLWNKNDKISSVGQNCLNQPYKQLLI